MFAALFVSLLSVYWGYLAQNSQYNYCLKLSFLLISCFLGFRYMWGNDLPTYYDLFLGINENEWDNIFDISYDPRIEYGWKALNALFKPFGFLGLQIFLAVSQNLIIYLIVKKYVQPQWYWLAIFIYCFNTNFMVLSASMMRQFLAMIICVASSYFIIKQRPLLFLLCIFLAYSFHSSAICFLPAYLFVYLAKYISYKHLPIIILLLICWLIGGQYFVNNISSAVIDALGLYEGYMDSSVKVGFGLGILLKVILAVLLLSQIIYFSKEEKVLVFLTLFSFLLIPFLLVSPAFLRIGYYYEIFSIVSYPILMNNTSISVNIKRFYLILIILLNIYGFYHFFTGDIFSGAYYQYNSIFNECY